MHMHKYCSPHVFHVELFRATTIAICANSPVFRMRSSTEIVFTHSALQAHLVGIGNFLHLVSGSIVHILLLTNFTVVDRYIVSVVGVE